jgi:predicted outer membrane repeat protein
MSSNTAASQGGVAYLESAGWIYPTISTSTVSSNTASSSGGVIYIPNYSSCSSSTVLSGVTMSGNTATSSHGGVLTAYCPYNNNLAI